VKAGTDPEIIIGGARRYREVEQAAGRTGTEKIAQAITWLNQERFNDYPAFDRSAGPPDPSMPSEAELREKYAKLRAAEDQTRLSGDQKPEDAGVFREGGQVHSAGGDGLHDPAGNAGMGRSGCRYFDRHIGARPYGVQVAMAKAAMMKEDHKAEITVPTQFPEWFDSSQRQPGRNAGTRPIRSYGPETCGNLR
jgi:hypothetical protein